MFGIGGWEFAIIVILGLLLFGPDKLPEVVRTVNRFVRDFKRYQSMMESTFKAEMLAFDDSDKEQDSKKPGVKKTNQEFNKRVAGSTHMQPKKTTTNPESSQAEQPASRADIPDVKEAAVTETASSAETASAGVNTTAGTTAASAQKPTAPASMPYVAPNVAAAAAEAAAKAGAAAQTAAEANTGEPSASREEDAG